MGNVDRLRRNYEGDDYALVSELEAGNIVFTPAGTIAATDVQAAIEEVASEASGGGPHDHDHLEPLSEDAFAESDPIGDYPSGVSIMSASAAADWDGTAQDISVITNRTDTEGWQMFAFRGAGAAESYIQWRSASEDAWGGWRYIATQAWVFDQGFAFASDLHKGQDAVAESAGITSFARGPSVMLVSDTENWGPNTGEAGLVFTERAGNSAGRQVFTQTSNGQSYERIYTSGSWGSWTAFSMQGHTHTRSNITDFSHASTHTNGTDDIQNATSGQKGLMTSAYASKLDGIESGATADQSASEILSALLTVDGSGSLLDADKLDGNDASAFLTSAYYQTVKEGGTARTQRANLNFGNGLDATDNAGTSATDVVVDESELTHNSLGGLTTGDPHTQYHTDARGDARYTPLTRTISTTAPLTGGGDLSANRTLAVSAASDTAQGVVELATDAETNTGTDTARAITPANLSARTSTETRTGVVELATDAETQTGTDTARAITPANLSARSATETRTGVAEIATQAETDTGTDDARYITPLKLKTSTSLDARYVNETDYEDSDVLSKILNVDGAGSLLDADKLDGQEGAYYRDASNLNAGTVPTARLGSGTADSTKFLRGDQTWATPAGGSFDLTEVEVNLGSTLQTSGNFVISGLSGLNTGDPVLVRQAVGPYTGKGTLADEFEMDVVNVAGKVASASTIQCYWSTDSFVSGNFKFLYAVG